MRRLPIDEACFVEWFGRDADVHVSDFESCSLDLETGAVLRIRAGCHRGEDVATRRRIAEDPSRYLEIPGLDHDDHHGFLRSFLASKWTDDEDARRNAIDAYGRSIGGWIEAVRDELAVVAFRNFRWDAARARAEAFLQRQGIDPEWR